jgi:hypothetical protein
MSLLVYQQVVTKNDDFCIRFISRDCVDPWSVTGTCGWTEFCLELRQRFYSAGSLARNQLDGCPTGKRPLSGFFQVREMFGTYDGNNMYMGHIKD